MKVLKIIEKYALLFTSVVLFSAAAYLSFGSIMPFGIPNNELNKSLFSPIMAAEMSICFIASLSALVLIYKIVIKNHLLNEINKIIYTLIAIGSLFTIYFSIKFYPLLILLLEIFWLLSYAKRNSKIIRI